MKQTGMRPVLPDLDFGLNEAIDSAHARAPRGDPPPSAQGPSGPASSHHEGKRVGEAEDLRQARAQHQMELDKRDDIIRSLRKEVATLRATPVAPSSLSDASELQRLLKEKHNCETEKDALEGKVQQFEGQIKGLKNDLNDVTRQLETCTAELKTTRELREPSAENDLRQEIAKLEGILAGVRTDLAAKFAKYSELEQELHNKTDDIQRKDARITQLAQEKTVCDAETARLLKAKTAVERQLGLANEQLKQAEQDLSAARTSDAGRMANEGVLQQKIDKCEELVRQKELDLAKIRSQLAVAEQTLSGKQQENLDQLEAANKALEKSRAETQNAQQKNGTLLASLEACNRQVAELRRSLQACRDQAVENSSLQTQLKECSERVTQLQTELDRCVADKAPQSNPAASGPVTTRLEVGLSGDKVTGSLRRRSTNASSSRQRTGQVDKPAPDAEDPTRPIREAAGQDTQEDAPKEDAPDWLDTPPYHTDDVSEWKRWIDQRFNFTPISNDKWTDTLIKNRKKEINRVLNLPENSLPKPTTDEHKRNVIAVKKAASEQETPRNLTYHVNAPLLKVLEFLDPEPEQSGPRRSNRQSNIRAQVALLPEQDPPHLVNQQQQQLDEIQNKNIETKPETKDATENYPDSDSPMIGTQPETGLNAIIDDRSPQPDDQSPRSQGLDSPTLLAPVDRFVQGLQEIPDGEPKKVSPFDRTDPKSVPDTVLNAIIDGRSPQPDDQSPRSQGPDSPTLLVRPDGPVQGIQEFLDGEPKKVSLFDLTDPKSLALQKIINELVFKARRPYVEMKIPRQKAERHEYRYAYIHAMFRYLEAALQREHQNQFGTLASPDGSLRRNDQLVDVDSAKTAATKTWDAFVKQSIETFKNINGQSIKTTDYLQKQGDEKVAKKRKWQKFERGTVPAPDDIDIDNLSFDRFEADMAAGISPKFKEVQNLKSNLKDVKAYMAIESIAKALENEKVPIEPIGHLPLVTRRGDAFQDAEIPKMQPASQAMKGRPLRKNR